MIRRRESYRAVKPIGAPIVDDAHHPPVRPRQPPPPVPLDAYQLVRAITTARLLRDWPTADKLLAALERLAVRTPRAGGDRDDTDE